jgi:hypothetical protein
VTFITYISSKSNIIYGDSVYFQLISLLQKIKPLRRKISMRKTSISTCPISMVVIMIAIILLAIGPVNVVQGAESLPSYQLQFLGPGSPVAINNTGIVVGARVNSSSYYEPLVSVNGSAWSLLPLPSGAMSVFPTDVNDSGVIVGVSYSTQWNATAVRWKPTDNGFMVEELPRISGDSSSYATAINNLGQIVGARRVLGYVPASSTGWLYSDELGVVDLFAMYGWAVYPTDLNDNSQLIAGIERLDRNTGVIDNIGSGPDNYNPVTAIAINNNGMLAGSASLRSSSLNIISVFRYESAAVLWHFIAGSSKYTTVSSLNNLGDIGYGELGAGLYLNNQGTYALGSLLDPAVISAGWAITGNGVKINDLREAATVARNSITGASGGVLLTPTGTLAAPTAPTNLQGVAHSATRSEPYNSINLTWENTSGLTQSYELERRVAGTNLWTRLSLTPPGMATNHTDTTVEVGFTYEYQVRAVGIGGSSAWSNSATVTAPTTPLDSTAPVVTISTPVDGASVSGIIPISAQATDNVAIEYLQISYWNQYLGQEVIIGSVANAGTLSASWDTRSLTPATYLVRAYAYDTLGNWTQKEISVNVTASARNLSVGSITLSGTISGSKANITGYVYVKDNSATLVSNATVSIRWTLPNGSTKTATAKTNSAGRASFTVSGTRGTYTLTITNLTKTGYTFDKGSSVLTKSITK